MKFTSVFYVSTEQEANKKLNELRKVDKYPELKAYYIKEGDQYRVLRCINIKNLSKKGEEL